MNRRRRRPNWFRIILLCLLIGGGVYVDGYILPQQQALFAPTPTSTRDPESYKTEAEEFFKQGKLLNAIDAYKKAIASNPKNPAMYIAMARVQVFAGKYDDAVTSAEDALLLDANNSMSHAVRAWALDFQGNFLEAEASIKRALELDPNNALAHAYYVEILVDSYLGGTGTFEGVNKAIEESKIALALAPDTLETRRARGYILEAVGYYEEATREYQAAIAINPNIADLHLALGRNYRARGIYDQAVEEFARANALNPEDPTPDLLTSLTYASIGEFAKAMQYAETAVNNDPTNTNLRGNLGVMYYHNLLWPDAVEQLTFVVKGGFTDDGKTIEPIPLAPGIRVPEYYFTYGLALAYLNRCDEALPISQMLQTRVPADEISIANAAKIIELCQKNLNSPRLPTPAPTATETVVPTP